MAYQLPTRLFKLNVPAVRDADVSGSFDLEHKSLGNIIEGAPLSALKSCNYCAISHVWGTKLTTFVVNGIPWGVPILSKEKLIFMLKACERRGYEYVWIDLLCLNQKRDAKAEAEKVVEVQKMKQYYQNAHATIVFGFNWEYFASQWAMVDSRIKEWNGNWKKVIDADWPGFAEIDKLINDDWFARVWTLQEAVIPLTTTPSDTVVTHPAPYNRARLLTSDGVPMDLRGLCDLIGWTDIALGKLDYTDEVGTYSWIHPGAGIVNDHEWWTKAILNEAIGLGAARLHPIQAMQLTRHREVSQKFPIDKLKGVYALVDQHWYSKKTAPTPDIFYDELADKYITEKEGALLLTMAVNQKNQKTVTWAAAAFPGSNFGSVVPHLGEYPLIEANVNRNGTLSLTAAGLTNQITVHKAKSYGDGSGLLMELVKDLSELPSTFDTSAIVTLMNLAAARAQIEIGDSIDKIKSFIWTSTSNANTLSSALRAVFSGWHRWIFLVDNTKAILGWLPLEPTEQLPKCSLLWILPEKKNEWAVLVEGNPTEGYKKVGIAFVNSEPMGEKIDVVMS